MLVLQNLTSKIWLWKIICPETDECYFLSLSSSPFFNVDMCFLEFGLEFLFFLVFLHFIFLTKIVRVGGMPGPKTGATHYHTHGISPKSNLAILFKLYFFSLSLTKIFRVCGMLWPKTCRRNSLHYTRTNFQESVIFHNHHTFYHSFQTVTLQ